MLDCKACGQRSDVDLRLKLSSFILKNQPKKGKKDKSTKKAERRAKKEAGAADGDEDSRNGGSPGDSNSDNAEENGDVELGAGSDDELTRRINAEASNINEVEDAKEVEWSVDVSEEAVKARAKELPDDLKRALVVGDDDEDGVNGEGSAYDQFGKWILDTAAEKGGVSKLDDVDIYLKAKELGIETKHKTLTVLAQTIFDNNIVKQIDDRSGMLKKVRNSHSYSQLHLTCRQMITSERHEKAFLGGTERFVGKEKPNLIPQVSAILMKYYHNDLISEEVLTGWGSKASKKYVDLPTSKTVRKSAEKFMEWLANAESDESSDDE